MGHHGTAWARVKGCGKSAPRPRRRGRHGKPHREQNRIGTAVPGPQSPGTSALPRRRPGGLREASGNGRPRGMAIPRIPSTLRPGGWIRSGGQNPAYRPSGVFSWSMLCLIQVVTSSPYAQGPPSRPRHGRLVPRRIPGGKARSGGSDRSGIQGRHKIAATTQYLVAPRRLLRHISDGVGWGPDPARQGRWQLPPPPRQRQMA